MTSFVHVMTTGASRTISGPYQMVNKTVGSPTTIILPNVPGNQSQAYIIKDAKGDCATNNITVTPAFGLIDGAASFVMNVNRMCISVVFDGANWNIV